MAEVALVLGTSGSADGETPAGIGVEGELGVRTVFTVLLPRECVIDSAPIVLPGSA